MAFQQALSGLNAAAKNLDVIGNNVANVNTIGFKASRAEFADVYAATVAGTAGKTSAGIGTRTVNVSQSFSQGPTAITERPLDVAINGDGFFRMDDNGAVVYSRNGQFQVDKEGFLVGNTGLKLTGYRADAEGNIVTSAPVPIQLEVNTIEPKATDRAAQGVNLDSRAKPVRITNPNPPTLPAGTPEAAVYAAFDPLDATTFTKATSLTIHDSLGNPQTLTTYYVKKQENVALENGNQVFSGDVTWDVYATINGQLTTAGTPPGSAVRLADEDGNPIAQTTPGLLTSMTFNESGKPNTEDSDFILNLVIPGNGDADDVLKNGARDMAFRMDMSATTQYGQSFGVNVQSQNGYQPGELTGYSIGLDGVVQARYSNAQTRPQGQIVLTTFNNPQGLAPLGGNVFAETAASGTPRSGEPGTSNIGVTQSGALEEANLELTSELVSMITAQRAYQANAQTVKTQDSIMQTLVNLR